jgi:hypothetical protein
VEQLQNDEFDLDDLVDKLTRALADEPRRNEILSLKGDLGIQVIECLDKVSDL